MKAPEESPDTEVCCGFAPYAQRLAGAANARAATNEASMRLAMELTESCFFLKPGTWRPYEILGAGDNVAPT